MNRSGRRDASSEPSTAAAATTPPPTTTAATANTAAATAAKTTTSAAKAQTSTTPASSAATKATAAPSTPSPLGAAIHRVTSQLLTAAGDVRTPPKMRHQQESREGQGVAVPVILEEDELEHPEEVLTRRSPLQPASTSKPLEEGISTWVLLSGSNSAPSSTQPSPAPSSTTTKSPPKTTTTSKATKAPQKNTGVTTTTTKRPPGKPTPTPSKIRSPSTTRKPVHSTTAKPTTLTTAAASVSTSTVATTASKPKPVRNKTEIPALAPAMTRKPPTTIQKITTTTAKPKTTTAAVKDTVKEEPTTVLPIVTEVPEEENSTMEATEKTETSTRRTRRPGNGGKKKKKNKNKRRKNRPSANNATAVAESKIGEAETNSTNKPEKKDRPLSTRIYNYLAREVMPSFGVGLLGLAITAGLAGLIMYPFGGGAVRRTYEVDAPSLPQQGNFYYYGGEYDGEDHGQAEESVIRKVFEGMNSETEQSEDSRYANQRYSPDNDAAVASGTVTTYAGDVQASRYPTHRYDTGQTGYNANTAAQSSYNTGAQSSYNTRSDSPSYYNADQTNGYYPSSNSGASPTVASSTSANSTDITSNGGRVRYREVATGSVVDQSPNPQQITKKSDYYAYNTGRVRFRDVGTGQIHTDAPRVRFREVGSDTVHYSMSEPTSNEGGVEHGPRHVRVKRQLRGIKDVAKEIEKEDKEQEEIVKTMMMDENKEIDKEDKKLEEQARKIMDETKEMRNDIDLVHTKKNKPKKATPPGNKPKSKQDEIIIQDLRKPHIEMIGVVEFKPSMGGEETPVEIDDLTGEKGDAPDIVDAEIVTGGPETIEVEVVGENDNQESLIGPEMVGINGMGGVHGLPAYYPIMSPVMYNGMNAAIIESNLGSLGTHIEEMATEEENMVQETTKMPVEENVMPETTKMPAVVANIMPETTKMPAVVANIMPEITEMPLEEDNMMPEKTEMPAEEDMPEITEMPEEEENMMPEITEKPTILMPDKDAQQEEIMTTEPATDSGVDMDRLETTPATTEKVLINVPYPQFNLIDLLKKIAQLKLQLGIGLLKTTSQAFTSYLNNVQKRMENAIKEARTASYRRTNFWNFRREKRDAKKIQSKKTKRKFS